jgi:D-alanyl-lipoteichoic acid acyltransferase DltB (MBOAT superfamily)
MAVGVVALAIGLAKKVLLADSLALAATPLFQAADRGQDTSFLESWLGAAAYAFQIYFDFSGYSDMAIGLSLLFGIAVPVNFRSPYRAASITEFWRRWHITLSTFLRDYVYIPLGGNRCGAIRQRTNLMTTMLLGGLWHGAGWNFLLWGGLHGLFLVVHQSLRQHAWFARLAAFRSWRAAAWCMTFVAVVATWVPFRAETPGGSLEVLGSMALFEGADLPRGVALKLQKAGVPEYLARGEADRHIPVKPLRLAALLLAAFVIVTCCPCTAEICGIGEPAHGAWRMQALGWQAVVVAILLAAALISVGSPSEFLYFNF